MLLRVAPRAPWRACAWRTTDGINLPRSHTPELHQHPSPSPEIRPKNLPGQPHPTVIQSTARNPGDQSLDRRSSIGPSLSLPTHQHDLPHPFAKIAGWPGRFSALSPTSSFALAGKTPGWLRHERIVVPSLISASCCQRQHGRSPENVNVNGIGRKSIRVFSRGSSLAVNAASVLEWSGISTLHHGCPKPATGSPLGLRACVLEKDAHG